MNSAAAGKATAWSAADIVGRQLVGFAVSILLARLLTPADFGAVAIAAFFGAFVIAVVQQSLSTAIIQRQNAPDEETSAIFWWNLILSAALAALVAALGPAAARYFEVPVLAGLLVAAAAQILLSAFGSVHLALLTRDLRFRAIAAVAVPATFVSGAIGIALALSGAGVWALAAQLISVSALNSAGVWWACRWRPATVLRASGLVPALRFSRWLSLSSGLDILYTQGFALILGKLYGPRELGLYARATSTQQVPGGIISAIIGRVLLPLFAAHSDDPVALGRGLLAANAMAMTICLPALVGLALTADLVILVLFGPQWVEAGPVLAILAWAGIFLPLHVNNGQVLLASGRSHIFLQVEIAKKILGVTSVVIGSSFGIIGLAWSQLIFTVLALIINAWPSKRFFDCGLARQLSKLWAVATATAVMGAAVLVFRELIELPPFIELGASIILGISAYVVFAIILRVNTLWTLVDAMRAMISGKGLKHVMDID